MRRIVHSLLGLLALLLVIFLIQNADTVQLNFLFWSFSTRRAFLVLLMLLIGLAAGWSLARVRDVQHRRHTAQANQPEAPEQPPPPQ